MDAAYLTKIFALGAIVYIVGRFVLPWLDRAEVGFASLFVPPDRTLPWPRGVQESDAPWGWQPPPEELSAGDPDPVADIEPMDGRPLVHRAGSYVEPTRPVAPIHFRGLPQ